MSCATYHKRVQPGRPLHAMRSSAHHGRSTRLAPETVPAHASVRRRDSKLRCTVPPTFRSDRPARPGSINPRPAARSESTRSTSRSGARVLLYAAAWSARAYGVSAAWLATASTRTATDVCMHDAVTNKSLAGGTHKIHRHKQRLDRLVRWSLATHPPCIASRTNGSSTGESYLLGDA